MKHDGYYSALAEESLRAAQRILPTVFTAVPAASLIDIGCGPGSWARTAHSLGVERVVGVDGGWAERWADDSYSFRRRDLGDRIEIKETFDVAICLEVAQYLPLERLAEFVAELCDLAPAVLFSSRIPHQWDWTRSVGMWPSWWAERFAEHGRVPIDIVRPTVWSDTDIPAYYRQNVLLFVPVGSGVAPPTMLDVVHPELWSDAHRLTVRERCRIAAGIPAAVARSVSRRIRASKR